jgi:hypothetical protein
LKNEERVLFEEVLIAQQRVEDTSNCDEVRLHPSHKFANSKVLKQTDKSKKDNSAKDKVGLHLTKPLKLIIKKGHRSV